MQTLKKATVFLALLSLLMVGGVTLASEAEPAESQASNGATLLEVQDAIGPATSHYIRQGIETAAARGDALVVLALDTPGGLDSAMREIIQAILASPVPVATYVSPRGARAASAGTYILYASHVAAMSPATNLGSATPVPIGGAAPKAPQPEGDGDKASAADQAQQSSTAMERKTINDAVSYIRGLAEMHGRNAEWAEQAVREAANLTAEQALELGVIDLIASDTGELLTKIDGRTVRMADGERIIDSGTLVLQRIDPDWRTKLLAVITNPTVAYLLMLIGIYGLIFEGYNPGAVVPGVVGAICLLLALYAFQVLPVNYAGLALMLLGIVLMAAEAFVAEFRCARDRWRAGVCHRVHHPDRHRRAGLCRVAAADWRPGPVQQPAGDQHHFFRHERVTVDPFRPASRRMIGRTRRGARGFCRHRHGIYSWRIMARRTSAPVRAGDKVRVLAVEGLVTHG